MNTFTADQVATSFLTAGIVLIGIGVSSIAAVYMPKFSKNR